LKLEHSFVSSLTNLTTPFLVENSNVAIREVVITRNIVTSNRLLRFRVSRSIVSSRLLLVTEKSKSVRSVTCTIVYILAGITSKHSSSISYDEPKDPGDSNVLKAMKIMDAPKVLKASFFSLVLLPTPCSLSDDWAEGNNYKRYEVLTNEALEG